MEKKFKYQDKSIYYQVEGQGTTLILLHGFMEDMSMWSVHSATLSNQYCVISIDLPGHGKSEVISNNHSMELMADLVKQVMDLEQVKKAVLVGHSMGGYATLAFAEKYPGSLLGFGLFHSHTLADTEEVKKNRERTIEIVQKERMSFINQFIPSLYAKDNHMRLKEEIDHQISMANRMNPIGITAAIEGMKERPMRLDMVAFSKVPVLFILGKQDSRIPMEKAMAQASTAAIAQIVILDNVGHMAWQEEPQKTIAALSGFMELCNS